MLNKVLNVGGASIAQPITAVGNILDELFTSDDEKLDKQIIMQRLLQEPVMVQNEINKLEAQHRTIFVAGWRPFIGWVCGFALAWHFMVYDMAVWAQVVWWPDSPPPPKLVGTGELITVLLSLLGLGSLRTVEKMNGAAK